MPGSVDISAHCIPAAGGAVKLLPFTPVVYRFAVRAGCAAPLEWVQVHGGRCQRPSPPLITIPEGFLMARGINKVILISNLGADPATRAKPSATTVPHLRFATS